MSFVHFHGTQVPQSTRIKEDLLLSNDHLNTINRCLKTHAMGGEKVDKDLTALDIDRIACIYNQNVNYINYQCKNFKFFNNYFQTFEQYHNSHSNLNLTDARDNYEDLKTIEYVKFLDNWDEVRQLAQAGFLHLNLKGKIEKAIQRVVALDLYPADVFPALDIPLEKDLIYAYDSNFGFNPRPELRRLDYKSKLKNLMHTKELLRESSSTSSKSSSDQTVTTESSQTLVETSKTPPTTISAHIECDVINGVLGICHEPSWIEQPVLFSRSEKGWSGQIPVGIDFKFVIVENAKVTQWEIGLNRCLTAENPSIFLSADQVKFG
jgi:hypothetical protein